MSRFADRLLRALPGLILGVVFVALTLDCILGPRGMRDLIGLRRHRAKLEVERNRLQADNEQLKAEVKKLLSDRRYIERLVRGELGFARPDELVYRFGSEQSN